MFLIDDLLLRLFGISLKPFDMIWLLELTRNYALREKYDLKKINDQIKENRLFFEINEINEAEYEKNNELLLKEREVAEHVMANLSNDMRIQEL
ncbi:hypothetical protein HYX19_00305 [Candidatus Woesearchaeota archaeon]|nr:hypothetical protein [Candidatus Woesearchaeota archaeon]